MTITKSLNEEFKAQSEATFSIFAKSLTRQPACEEIAVKIFIYHYDLKHDLYLLSFRKLY